MKDLESIFKSAVKGENFMTPKVIEYGEAGNYVYELSTGYGLTSKLYGVTVVDGPTGKQLTKKSIYFHDLESAREYAENL